MEQKDNSKIVINYNSKEHIDVESEPENIQLQAEETNINNPDEEEDNNIDRVDKFYFNINIQTKVFAVLLIFFSILLFLALISHTTQDDTNSKIKFYELFNIFSDDPVIKFKVDTTTNLLGLLGAVISNFLINGTIGMFVIAIPIFLFIWGISLYKKGEISNKLINFTNIYIIFSLITSCFIGSLTLFPVFSDISQIFYGAIGIYIPTLIASVLSPVGTIIVFSILLILFIYKITTFTKLGMKQTFKIVLNYFNIKNLISKLNSMVNDNDRDTINNKTNNTNNTFEDNFNQSPINNNNSNLVYSRDYNKYKGEQETKVTNKEVSNDFENYSNKIKNDDYDIYKEKLPKSFEVKNVFDINKNSDDDIKIKNYDYGIKEDINIEKYKNYYNSKVLENEEVFLDKFKNKVNLRYINDSGKTDENVDKNNKLNLYINDKYEDTIYDETELQNHIEDKVVNSELSTNANYIPNRDNNYIIRNNSPLELDEEYLNVRKKVVNENNDVIPTLTLNIEPEVVNKIERTSKNRIVDDVTLFNSDTENNMFNNPLSLKILNENIKYKSPTFDLLDKGNESFANDTELREKAHILQEKLKTFKITISSLQVTKGPVVTQYEFIPDDGIKISKIEGLEDDLAMALKAKSIRIIAPIPGKGTVGIQIPNANPSIVKFRSVVETEKFISNKFELPIALGKLISGEPYIADLSTMPHLLIAGSTGSGKSVGINTIISSLLYKKHPRQLKFIIVDPKKVELQHYSILANHFLAISPDIDTEIVTSPTDAITALQSAVVEMEMRYDILSKVGQRNIKDYNMKVREGAFNHIKDFSHHELPYIVVIIDELADLMLTGKKEIETPIVRLAQMARAIGIHLVVATQRPSVDVITGVIKANFPARLAYRVASKVDSRTILDASGAEALLGNGDMLFLPASQPIRIQNPFISNDEVERICEFIGNQEGYSSPYILPSVLVQSDDNEFKIDEYDPLFKDAAKIFIEQQQASTSLLQRKLSIGFARAGRIVDQLEAAGIIGKSQGSKPRDVYLESIAELDKII